MTKMNFKWAMIALAALAVVSCGGNDTKTDGNDEKEDEFALVGGGVKNPMSTTKTLKSGETYTLEGEYFVASPGKLIIEKGVTIVAKDGDDAAFILIEKGATIEAKGTADAPIIMTSEVKERGAWAGLHICGDAPINATAGEASSEVGTCTYGGSDANDNSGVLEYVRIENAGHTYGEKTEANGFSFYGVGAGTKISHIQADNGADDGIEFFGGTVNVKYVVSSNNKDDAFDWTQGWCGNVQFLVVKQGAGLEADQTIEGDNSKTDYKMGPISCPTLANITLIGCDNGSNTSGVLLRNGTHFNMYNAILTGKTSNLVVDGADDEKNAEADDKNPTDTSLDSGISSFNCVAIAGSFTNKAGDAAAYGQAEFVAAGNLVDQTFSLTNAYVGTVAGGFDMTAVDSFFVAADYKGAVEASNDWTKGWTKFAK